jgi:urea transport system substrate-binding protein
MAESCYEGLMTLASLAERAGSLDVRAMLAVADGLGYDGPRGAVSFAGNHLQQPVHLAVADGYDFDVLAAL